MPSIFDEDGVGTCGCLLVYIVGPVVAGIVGLLLSYFGVRDPYWWIGMAIGCIAPGAIYVFANTRRRKPRS